MARTLEEALEGKYLRVSEAARYLGVSSDTIYRLEQRGELRGVRILAAHQVETESLLAYEAKLRAAQAWSAADGG